MEDDFAVGACAEDRRGFSLTTSLVDELALEIEVVVDLPVDAEDDRLIAVSQRLCARIHADDGESLVAEEVVADDTNA